MKRRLAFVASIAVLAPASASAQDHHGHMAQKASWLNQCTVGAFQACASFSISLRYDPYSTGELSIRRGEVIPEGFTRVTLGIANLQGLDIGLPDSGAWLFRDLTVFGMSTTWTTATDAFWFEMRERHFESDGTITVLEPEDYSVFPPEHIETPASSFRGWESQIIHATSTGFNPFPTEPGEHVFWAGTPYSAYFGLSGCDAVLYSGPTYRGCGATAYVSYDLPGEWTLTDDTRISWSGWPHVDGGYVGCTLGVDCAHVTVPEPSTALLWASGLIGLVLARTRRRKQLA